MPAATTLFTPYRLGGLTLRNRIVMSPMSSKLSTENGEVTPDLVAYYEARARGGVGLITVEYCCVDTKMGHAYKSQLALDTEAKMDGHRRLLERLKEQGAAVALQLHHAGGQADPTCIEDGIPLAPSAREYNFFGAIRHARAATDSEVERIVENFAHSARRAIACGYDALELHGAHGYLLAQFLSPHTNHRNDRWGGDADRRLALPRAVIRAVKAELGPDRPLLYRFSVDEFVEGGLDMEQSRYIAPRLVEAGADAIVVSTGTLENVQYAVDPMSMAEQWRVPLMNSLRETVSVPVLGPGPFRDPASAEASLQDGAADLVVLGRPLLADPEWVNKAARGEAHLIRHCTSCNWCVGRKRIGCAENPLAGRELDPAISEFGTGRHAVVIGAGPGGMAAALMLDSAGFDVSLIEQSDEVGGGIIASAAPPHKDRLLWYRDYLRARLERSGVSVRLSQSVGKDDLVELAPDLVVLATGAQAKALGIPREDSECVDSAYRLLMSGDDPQVRNRRVVVYGGGETGCETAEFLVERGATVTLISRSGPDQLARAAEPLYRRELLSRLADNPAIDIRCDSTVTEIEPRGVRLSANGHEQFLPADRVILAQGRIAHSELAEALENLGIAYRVIGDAHEIRRIGDAVSDAYLMIRELERNDIGASAGI